MAAGWYKFTVSSNGTEETWEYVHESYSNDEIEEWAREWASGTSIGTLRDFYTVNFDGPLPLPPEVRAAKIKKYQDQIRGAESMLLLLTKGE
jgi:hypothetical protein